MQNFFFFWGGGGGGGEEEEDIFKPTTGNDSLLQDSRDHGVKSSKLCHVKKSRH